EATVLSCKRAGDALVATIEGLSDRDIALAMKGTRIHIPRKRFKKPAKDEFYYVDLIGMAVVNREGVALGNVSNIMETGAHAVLVVTDEAGGEKPAERLIPFVSHYVDKVDTLAKRITCDWDPSY
ncbi:MAG: 16S rRNA processing protein RimM, partial [Thermoguttaceae bacterium]|nr:16S rRNA processing protein RimM [Thermoguttaceae bacterium]